jgi:hypothetical protein
MNTYDNIINIHEIISGIETVLTGIAPIIQSAQQNGDDDSSTEEMHDQLVALAKDLAYLNALMYLASDDDTLLPGGNGA